MEEQNSTKKEIEQKIEELEINLTLLSEKINEVVSCLNDHRIYRKVPVLPLDYEELEDNSSDEGNSDELSDSDDTSLKS